MSIDDYINSAPEGEKERRRLQMTHAFTWYSLTGEHNPHEAEHENLFRAVASVERYVVDNNSNWKSVCQQTKAANIAFIIGRTVQNEQSNLKATYFGAHNRKGNLFDFGVIDIGGEPRMELARIDAGFQSVFDKRRLDEESHEVAKRNADVEFVARQRTELEKVNNLREHILSMFSPFQSVAAIPEAHKEALRIMLLMSIQKKASGAYLNFWRAVDV